MSVTVAQLSADRPRPDEATLREVVEALEGMVRLAGSPGEREAAEWIAARLERAGARNVSVDDEQFHDGFAGMLAKLLLGAAVGGIAGARGHKRLGAGLAAGAAALIADDVSNGLRPWRKATMPVETTTNVVAEVGDPEAERTLVLLAHHDAARTGQIFDPSGQEVLAEAFPGLVERMDTSAPLWWLTLLGPLLAAGGSLSGRRKTALAGAALSTLGAAILADIERSEVVPGANDNLSAVASLVAIAERVAADPESSRGVRIVLATCGAEEVLQGGIYGFCDRHLAGMDREKTWVLNLDTVGSPALVLLEGEGCVVMEDYFDLSWRDLIADVAREEKIPLRRGMRARTSTDTVLPSRMAIPTACLVSITRFKSLSNYHLPSDTSEKLHWSTVQAATDLSLALARRLSAGS